MFYIYLHTQREIASTKYKYAIEGMQQNELQEQQAMEAQKISNEELQLHKVTTITIQIKVF